MPVASAASGEIDSTKSSVRSFASTSSAMPEADTNSFPAAAAEINSLFLPDVFDDEREIHSFEIY